MKTVSVKVKNDVPQAYPSSKYEAEVIPEQERHTTINIIPPPHKEEAERAEMAKYAREAYQSIQSLSALKDSKGNIIADTYAKQRDIRDMKEQYLSKREFERKTTEYVEKLKEAGKMAAELIASTCVKKEDVPSIEIAEKADIEEMF